MLKTAHDAEEFMRTGARVSPSWPGGDLRGRIRCSRLISRRSRQNPLQTGRAIRFNSLLSVVGCLKTVPHYTAFLPGLAPGSTKPHFKHGLGALVIGLAALAFRLVPQSRAIDRAQ